LHSNSKAVKPTSNYFSPKSSSRWSTVKRYLDINNSSLGGSDSSAETNKPEEREKLPIELSSSSSLSSIDVL